MKQAPCTNKNRSLLLVDDGWRWEKQDIIHALKQGWDFDIATHDVLSQKKLSEQFDVRLLPVHPLRRGVLYTVVMFFARSLDTNLVRFRERIKFLSRGFFIRVLFRIRSLASYFRIRCYRYSTALSFLYRRSDYYRELLAPYSMLVYSPVTVRDKRILFEAKRLGIRVVSWVYSWDNPIKDNEFLVDADDYLVWNDENRMDLVRYHGINSERIHVVGPAQFDFYVEMQERYAHAKPETNTQPYVLYACAMGLHEHVLQEIELIIKIRGLLDLIDPDMPLWVRPYPFRVDKRFEYTALRNRRGIHLLNFGCLEGNRILVEREELEDKYQQIANARCLINFGSTLGLEASFAATPIIQVGFNLPFSGPDYLDVRYALQSEHLRYMIDTAFPNTVTSLDALQRALYDVLKGDSAPYMTYQAHLQSFAHPLKVHSYRGVLRDTLQRLETESIALEQG